MSIQRLLLAMILMLSVSGCMDDAERDLYRKVTVSCEIVSVNPTEYRWDSIVVEFPNGQRCRVRVSRNMYQPGDVYHKQMWKWQAIERGVIDL
jgi:hypothetical protein